jgi:hypothetical protein
MSSLVSGFLGTEGMAYILRMPMSTRRRRALSMPSKEDLLLADAVKKATAAASLSTTDTEAESSASYMR